MSMFHDFGFGVRFEDPAFDNSNFRPRKHHEWFFSNPCFVMVTHVLVVKTDCFFFENIRFRRMLVWFQFLIGAIFSSRFVCWLLCDAEPSLQVPRAETMVERFTVRMHVS